MGNAGGASSSVVPLLLGGLLKGEILSLGRLGTWAGELGCEKSEKRAAPISGFSARLTGGGMVGLPTSLFSRSLLSSPDRRGGGGDGGFEGVGRADTPDSWTGVRGRPGILNCFVAVAAVGDLIKESVFTNAGRSPVGIPTPLLGGEWGGSIVSDGGWPGRGLMGGGSGRVGDVERPTLAAGGLMLGTFNLSLGRAAGTVGGSRAAEGLGSRSRSRTGLGAVAGAGLGDAVLEEAPVCGLVVVSVLFRFSNLAKSEDTGL